MRRHLRNRWQIVASLFESSVYRRSARPGSTVHPSGFPAREAGWTSSGSRPRARWRLGADPPVPSRGATRGPLTGKGSQHFPTVFGIRAPSPQIVLDATVSRLAHDDQLPAARQIERPCEPRSDDRRRTDLHDEPCSFGDGSRAPVARPSVPGLQVQTLPTHISPWPMMCPPALLPLQTSHGVTSSIRPVSSLLDESVPRPPAFERYDEAGPRVVLDSRATNGARVARKSCGALVHTLRANYGTTVAARISGESAGGWYRLFTPLLLPAPIALSMVELALHTEPGHTPLLRLSSFLRPVANANDVREKSSRSRDNSTSNANRHLSQ